MTIKIVSTAQHAMIEKAANDADYAAKRGIDQELAKQSLIDHAKQGAPKLPERVGPPTVAPRMGAEKATFLTSQRG